MPTKVKPKQAEAPLPAAPPRPLDHELRAMMDRAKSLSTERLKAMFDRGFKLNARHLREQAAILHHLELRGVTVECRADDPANDHLPDYLKYLRLISSGRVRVDAIVTFGGKAYLPAVLRLPVEAQQELAAHPEKAEERFAPAPKRPPKPESAQEAAERCFWMVHRAIADHPEQAKVVGLLVPMLQALVARKGTAKSEGGTNGQSRRAR